MTTELPDPALPGADPFALRHGSAPSPSLRAVVFDWAGTLIDFGSHAPMGAFVELFRRHGVEVSIAEARVPMGLPKWDHIRALCDQPRVAAAWAAVHGSPPGDAEVDRLYEAFTPMSVAAAVAHADLIPGALEAVERIRARGIAIASTTGYHAPIVDAVLPEVRRQGLDIGRPVCAGDVPVGRPSPFAVYRCLSELQAWPAWRVLKVDDTVPGLMEGRHAGCWTVGVACSGNALGLTAADWAGADLATRALWREEGRARLAEAAPDHVIDTVADLPALIERIDARLRNGERPAPT